MIPYDFYYQITVNNLLNSVDCATAVVKLQDNISFDCFKMCSDSETDNFILFSDQEPIDRQMFIHNTEARLQSINMNRFKNKIVITSERGPEIETLAKQYNFKTFDYFYHGLLSIEWYRSHQFENIQPNNNFDRTYITYNNLTTHKRLYRSNLLIELTKQNLLEHGYVSFNAPNPKLIQNSIYAYKYLLPTSHKENIENNLDLLANRYILDSDSVDGTYSAKLNVNGMQKAFVNLVTETIFYENKVHLTEKAFKPVVAKMPFILLAGPGSLSYMKSYGFKTFGDFWDESYDEIISPEKRFNEVVKLLKQLSAYSIHELQEMHKKMIPILEHNFNHFYYNLKPIIVKEYTHGLGNVLSEYNIAFDRTGLDRLHQKLLY